jgi:hypothetical protein
MDDHKAANLVGVTTSNRQKGVGFGRLIRLNEFAAELRE